MKDLWPAELGINPVKSRAPLIIMKEQASLLGQKTGNLLKAEVVQKTRSTVHGAFN